MRFAVLLVAFAALAFPESSAERTRNFADPPAEFRPMPLWVWHDEMRWDRLAEQLAQFRQQGFGGVFVHPRPGLMTEYLGEEWFRLWRQSLDEGKRLGLIVNIYDENSYPAGFAGGHVPARAPDTTVQGVQPEMGIDPARIRWNQPSTLGVYAIEKNSAGAVVSCRRINGPSEVKSGEAYAVFHLYRAQAEAWTADFPYVDLTNPSTGRMFLETTFEPYKNHFGAEFGKGVRWIFDDEPLLTAGGAYSGTRLGVPLSYNTLAEFRKRAGYDLAATLPSLYWDVGNWRRVRFDYYQTLHDLWKENYFAPIYEWCNRNHIAFTGHWMEHEWPYPLTSPSDASLYAYEHMPGIDMLTGLQALGIRTEGRDPFYLFTVRQMTSVAEQLGRRAFAESFGVSGFDADFEHFKRLGDWMLVHGVNFINPCQSWGTVRGARKRDYPPTFTDASGWWPYYRYHADHMSRVSYMLTRGKARKRVLVLEPTTSGFLSARRAAPTPELAEMRKDFSDLVQTLADHQVDFHLGDEYILEWFGKQDGMRLAVGEQSYDVVVWPRNMINVRRQTLPRIEKFLASGGQVLALGDPAAYVDGRASDAVRALREKYSSTWRDVAAGDQLIDAIRRIAPPHVRFEKPLPPGVGMAERFLDNGERVLFFTNSGPAPVRTRATVDGNAMERWNTVKGETSAASYRSDANGITFDLDLLPAGSEMFVVKPNGSPAPSQPASRFLPLQTGEWTARQEDPNVLVLDYCDFSAQGQEQKLVHTWRANWALWQAHGFERPAWDNAVQFKTRVFDRNHFPPESGFDAVFHFEVAGSAPPARLELAIECPELYRVTVNGAPVDFTRAARWLDPHIKSASISSLAKPGENTVRISGHPFDVRMELENIYIRGDFSVDKTAPGFRLSPAKALALGSWAAQGRPFYPGTVLYETNVDVPAGAPALRVELAKWSGALVEILLNGRRAALLGWPPYAAEVPTAPGRHTVALRVIAPPRNVFGPFLNPSKPRMAATPQSWSDPPRVQPPGAQYDVLDYGLYEAPRISARLKP
jgi:hypothetical protein